MHLKIRRKHPVGKMAGAGGKNDQKKSCGLATAAFLRSVSGKY
jgi:hypothetical protein